MSVEIYYKTPNLERDKQIMHLLDSGMSAKAVSEEIGCCISTVRKAKHRATPKSYLLTQTDGITVVEVGLVHTSEGFIGACIGAYKRFAEHFKSLNCPQWKITDGTQSMSVLEIRKMVKGVK